MTTTTLTNPATDFDRYTVKDMPAEERAARGAQLLDAERPGWHDQLDLETLEIWNPRSCVLGQLYSDYSDGLEVLGVTGRLGETAFGFCDAEMDFRGDVERAWETEVLERRVG